MKNIYICSWLFTRRKDNLDLYRNFRWNLQKNLEFNLVIQTNFNPKTGGGQSWIINIGRVGGGGNDILPPPIPISSASVEWDFSIPQPVVAVSPFAVVTSGVFFLYWTEHCIYADCIGKINIARPPYESWNKQLSIDSFLLFVACLLWPEIWIWFRNLKHPKLPRQVVGC